MSSIIQQSNLQQRCGWSIVVTGNSKVLKFFSLQAAVRSFHFVFHLHPLGVSLLLMTLRYGWSTLIPNTDHNRVLEKKLPRTRNADILPEVVACCFQRNYTGT
ncbi:unnamed protein product, partial [Ectocarpus sp. 12 AP-2014]